LSTDTASQVGTTIPANEGIRLVGGGEAVGNRKGDVGDGDSRRWRGVDVPARAGTHGVAVVGEAGGQAADDGRHAVKRDGTEAWGLFGATLGDALEAEFGGRCASARDRGHDLRRRRLRHIDDDADGGAAALAKLTGRSDATDVAARAAVVSVIREIDTAEGGAEVWRRARARAGLRNGKQAADCNCHDDRKPTHREEVFCRRSRLD